MNAEACTQLPSNATPCSRVRTASTIWLTGPEEPTPSARSVAIAPATAGVAIDVPLMYCIVPPSGDGQAVPPAPVITDEQIDWPAAITSTWGPSFENAVVPPVWSSTAPTAIAVEMHAGDDTPVPHPSLPAAIAVAMPTDRNWSMYGFSGSSSHAPAWNTLSPRLMFTDARPVNVARLL